MGQLQLHELKNLNGRIITKRSLYLDYQDLVKIYFSVASHYFETLQFPSS
jgi:hypothetical protein